MKSVQLGFEVVDSVNPVTDRFERLDNFDDVPAFVIDIPETIPQLGYGTHQFFRYYGKFPSVLGAEIIAKFGRTGGNVLDCYAGSGTTLVEAQIAGSASYGVDINPLAVFACNVKTRFYEYDSLLAKFNDVLGQVGSVPEKYCFTDKDSRQLKKWFTDEAVSELFRLRGAILQLDASPERDFLILAFLAIIRRTSNAYDGEVRPHINPLKRPTLPFRAFERKFADMMKGLIEVDSLRTNGSSSFSVVGDNRDPATYAFLRGTALDLVIAHPPYLNSFNYLQVYGPEFIWSRVFEEVWQGWTEKEIKSLEQRAWPATDAQIVSNYYENFALTIKAATAPLQPNGVLAVVVGDATIRGELEPVHINIWRDMKTLGLAPLEIWFRTTHYGIGKYAYRHRADYHGAALKRDAILFFRKP